MSVKLLQKSELATLKAKERAFEVREGVKLATKVDGLRELAAKTEQELERYRISTLSAIQEEITKKNTEKETVIGDVRQLRSTYDSMLPEISLKRTELAQFEKSLKSWEKKLEQREEVASLAEIDVAEALDKAHSSQIMSEDNERITGNLLKQAHEKKIEAQHTLEEARNLHTKTQEDAQETEERLTLRELSIQTKEKELSRKELELMHTEKALTDEQIKVADIKATLERSLARLKAGRRA